MTANGASVVLRTDASAHARLRAVPIGDVTLHDGLWQRRIAANREHGIPRLLERMESRGSVDNFRIGQPATSGLVRRGYWFSDSDVYKWLEAAAWSLAAHPDPGLGDVVSRVVDAIVGAQDPDGYLNTNFARSAAPARPRLVARALLRGPPLPGRDRTAPGDRRRAPARRVDALRRLRRRPVARRHRHRQPPRCRDGPRRAGPRDRGRAVARARSRARRVASTSARTRGCGAMPCGRSTSPAG